MAKRESDLERITATLSQEIRDQSSRLAQDLFPKGPPGHQTMSREAELDMIARHWPDPTFRKTLLTRVAPPGPNGYPDPILAERFIDLYYEAVLKRGSVEQDTPNTQAQNAGTQPAMKTPGPAPMADPLAGGGPATLGQTTANPAVSPTPPGAPPEMVPTTPPQTPGATQVAQNIAPPPGGPPMGADVAVPPVPPPAGPPPPGPPGAPPPPPYPGGGV